MPKAKNPATCRLQINDRVTLIGGRTGQLVERRPYLPSFGVRIDGQHWTNYYYRDQLKADLTPTEPEPYEAWFVA